MVFARGWNFASLTHASTSARFKSSSRIWNQAGGFDCIEGNGSKFRSASETSEDSCMESAIRNSIKWFRGCDAEFAVKA